MFHMSYFVVCNGHWCATGVLFCGVPHLCIMDTSVPHQLHICDTAMWTQLMGVAQL